MMYDMVPASGRRALDQWRVSLAAGGRSPHTIKLRVGYVAQALTAIGKPPYRINTEDLQTWLAAHDTWKPETRRAAILGVKGFYAWAVKAGHVGASPAQDLELPRVYQSPAKPIPEAALEQAVARANGEAYWLLRLLATTGLRRAEAANLHTDALEGDWLRVTGKGGKTRLLPLPEDVRDWLACKPRGWVFPAADGPGPIEATALANKVARLTGGWRPHSIRHRYATRIYQATGDLLVVQQLLGHASPTTTTRYTQQSPERLTAAAATLWVA